jgi:hypothetical protein
MFGDVNQHRDRWSVQSYSKEAIKMEKNRTASAKKATNGRAKRVPSVKRLVSVRTLQKSITPN